MGEATVFRPYPLQAGQRIRIEGGPRGGDWEVVAVTTHKVRLRCPISGCEYEWDRFCYAVEPAPTTESASGGASGRTQPL